MEKERQLRTKVKKGGCCRLEGVDKGTNSLQEWKEGGRGVKV